MNRPFQDRQGNDWYVWGDTCVRPWIADSYSEMKRLTDAELAAEYWMHYSGWIDGHGKKARQRRATLHRFATLPHYDEDQP